MARKKQDQSSNKESRSNPKKSAASKSRKTSAGNKRGQGRDFPVIGIGPSAGGLEAFAKFFSAMPTDTGMAFVLVQHHDPTHTSNMVDLLRRQTKMPVTQATDSMKLESGWSPEPFETEAA